MRPSTDVDRLNLPEVECYFVIEHEGGWLVTFDSQGFGKEFSSRRAALNAALEAAEARWLMIGLATRVEVKELCGTSTIAAGFGTHADDCNCKGK